MIGWKRLLYIGVFWLAGQVYAQQTAVAGVIPFFNAFQTRVLDSLAERNQWILIYKGDSLNLNVRRYQFQTETPGIFGTASFLFSDTALQVAVIDVLTHPEHKSAQSHLKRSGFRLVNNGIDGDFITSTYVATSLTAIEGYMALEHPSGKAHIPLFRYTFFRKYSPFDHANGQKKYYRKSATDSVLYLVETRENGVLHGDRVYVFPNGQVQRTELWKNGHQYGTANDYDEHGKLLHSTQFAYDWRIGQEKWYDQNGKVIASKSWNKDVPTGTYWKKYDGHEVMAITYAKGVPEGQAIIAIYSDNITDSIRTEPENVEVVNFVNGKKQGIAFGLTLDRADTIYHCFYKNDLRDSVFERMVEGRVVERTWWINGQLEGLAEYFIPSGDLAGTCYRRASYKNGKLNGRNEIFFVQQVQAIDSKWYPVTYVMHYANGQIDGPFEIVKAFQQFQERGTYKLGKLDGYYEKTALDGEELSYVKGWYKNGDLDSIWETRGLNSGFRTQAHYRTGKKVGVWSIWQGDNLQRRWNYSEVGYVESYECPFPLNSWMRYEIDSTKDSKTYISAQITTDSCLVRYHLVEPFDPKETPDGLQYGLHYSSESEIAEAAIGKRIRQCGQWLEMHEKQADSTWHLLEITNTETTMIVRNQPGQASWIPVYFEQNGSPFTGTYVSADNTQRIRVRNGKRHGWSRMMDGHTNSFTYTYFRNGKHLFHLPFSWKF